LLGDVEFAFPAGYYGSGEAVADDVHGGAAHVDKGVDAEQHQQRYVEELDDGVDVPEGVELGAAAGAAAGAGVVDSVLAAGLASAEEDSDAGSVLLAA